MASRRLWISLGLLVTGLVTSSVAVRVGVRFLETLGGTLILAGIILAMMATPWWERLAARVPPMPRLFPRLPAGSRWCAVCGTAAAKEAPCPRCGALPDPPRLKRKRA